MRYLECNFPFCLCHSLVHLLFFFALLSGVIIFSDIGDCVSGRQVAEGLSTKDRFPASKCHHITQLENAKIVQIIPKSFLQNFAMQKYENISANIRSILDAIKAAIF